MFSNDVAPRFFAPAGVVEALLIRLKYDSAKEGPCGHAVVLRGPKRSLKITAVKDFPPLDAPLPEDVDILKFATEHPPFDFGRPSARIVNGVEVPCRYWDCELEKAEDFLKPIYPRPYRIENVVRWYEGTCDEKTRANLLCILAASRDPRAALILGNAMRSPSFDIRLAAIQGLNLHFGAALCSGGGGLEDEFRDAEDWFQENVTRLLKHRQSRPDDSAPFLEN